MIDYELLCQTIEDWRAGRRPSIDLSASPVGAETGGYAEADQGYGGYDQGQYGEPGQYADPGESYGGYEQQGGYEQGYEQQDGGYEQGYEQQGGYEQGYDGYEYDGAPASVPGGGTSPMEVTELDEYEQ